MYSSLVVCKRNFVVADFPSVTLSLSLSLSLSRSPESEFHHGVVLSNRPLIDGELFEVEISAMQERWQGSVELGVTTHR